MATIVQTPRREPGWECGCCVVCSGMSVAIVRDGRQDGRSTWVAGATSFALQAFTPTMPAMDKLGAHLRKAFLAGLLAVGPVAVTIFVVVYIEAQTRAAVQNAIGRTVAPFVGVLLAVAVVYVVGVIVSSLIGRILLRLTDKCLSRLPVVKSVYSAWKQIALTPGGGEGMYARVVLIGGSDAAVPDALQMGFTSGDSLPGSDDLLPVFVPQCPNPLNGRLLLVPRSQCRMTNVSAEDAFKMILSTGNFVPSELAVSKGVFHTG